ncbi:MAG: ABC transporter permease [Candidatus Bipolaricaulota bacterium]
MLAYIARRVLSALPTMLGVVVLVFVLVRLTGDPARFVLGDHATDEAVALFRSVHGLDRPLHVQFASYLAGLFRGDLGTSLRYEEAVGTLFAQRWPYTLQLSALSLMLSVIIGVGVGAYTAVHAGGYVDRVARYLAVLGQSIPGFYLGLLLIIGVAVNVPWIPTGGAGSFRHLLLPAVSLSAHFVALIARYTRSCMLDALHEGHIRTAWAKGLAERSVVWRHAFRNSLIGVITLVATQMTTLFSGAVVTETVFAWPGIGRLAVLSILNRDYVTIQGLVVVFTVAVIVINVLVDVAYAFFDPRIVHR